ncbi:MAG: hypothetical protein F4X95_02475, partial [Oligoflexia bacterium]|nr:hypothetical protein [Oligoflexia bacterium]
MKNLFLPTLILSLWVLNSCSFFNRNPVVLQINSHKLTARQFAKRLVQKIHALNIQDVKSPELLEKLKRQLITDLIMEFLIKEFAQSHSVSISKKELHQALQRIKSKYPDEEAFEWYLKRKKTRAEKWTEHIKNNLLSKKVMQKMGSKTSPPSLKEIKEYYQNHPSLFKQKPRVLIYHIFHKQKEVLIKIEKSLKLEKNLMKVVKKFIKDPLILKPQWVEKGILPIFD